MSDLGTEFSGQPENSLPIERARSVVDRLRKNFPSSKQIKIGAAASLGFLSSACSTAAKEQVLPMPEPIPIVWQSEEMGIDGGKCYKLVDRVIVEVPGESANASDMSFTCVEEDKKNEGRQFELIAQHPEVTPPDDLSESVSAEIQPIYDLAPGGSAKKRSVVFFEGDQVGYINNVSPTIHIGINDEILASEDLLKLTASHEAAHTVQVPVIEDEEFKNMFVVMTQRSKQGHKAFRQHARELSEEQRKNYSEVHYSNSDIPETGSLFSLVDESTYLKDSFIGHPRSSEGELFASTTTVLRYFPNSFMASVDKQSPEDREFMRKLTRKVVSYFRDGENGVQRDVTPLFSQELVDWLYSVPETPTN